MKRKYPIKCFFRLKPDRVDCNCRHTIIFKGIWATSWQNQQCGCAPSEDSDQPGHSPSLIRVFAVRMKKAWVLSYPLSAQRRLWSDWANAQADLSLRWAHSHFVGFVMRRLISVIVSFFLFSQSFSETERCSFWQVTLPPFIRLSFIKTYSLSQLFGPTPTSQT